MPRGRRSANENRLAEIISKHVDELVAAVSQEVRRTVALEIQAMVTGGKVRGVADAGLVRKPKRRNIRPCIAPNCPNPSKGPRFHYLCDKHKDAPKKDYEAWRKQRGEKAGG